MIRINPSTISGHMHAIPNKAHAQRLLFMASMPAMPTRIKNVPRCNDIDTTIACLEDLGCQIVKNTTGTEIVVTPFPKTSPLPDVELNFKESATTARLAIALCSALGIKANCRASGTLLKRKMIQLSGRLALRGVTFSGFSLPFVLSGRMAAGDYIFSEEDGLQSISSLMMFTPCLLGDSQLKLEKPIADKSILELTRKSLKCFQIETSEENGEYFTPGRQYYQSPGEVTVENDWSIAAMWIAAAAACGARGKGLVVDNLPQNSPQLYRNLEAVNAMLYQDYEDVNVDATYSPDLATLYAALTIVRGASITITGVAPLRQKETDRLRIISNIAHQFNQDVRIDEDSLRIIGNGNPVYPEEAIDCQGDPWIFMSMCLASTKAKEQIVLSDESCAEKIYKDFLEDFKNLGGSFVIV